MNLFFPREICHHIVSYVPNIETRMYFGIYHKINTKHYEEKLNTYIRKKGVNWINHTRYFSIQNIEYDSQGINDFVDMQYKCANDTSIFMSIFIWKLKERTICNWSKGLDDDLLFDDNYYWCVKEINYNIS